jgi:hypothetical protein
LKHEVGWKTFDVSFDCFIKTFGFHSIKLGNIRVQNHVFSAEPDNERGELLGDEGGGCQF